MWRKNKKQINLEDRLWETFPIIDAEEKESWRELAIFVTILLILAAIMFFVLPTESASEAPSETHAYTDKVTASLIGDTVGVGRNEASDTSGAIPDPCTLQNVYCDVPTTSQGHIVSQPGVGIGDSYQAVVTAYSEFDSCHYPGCKMANNIPAEIGYIACPTAYEFGTKVEIAGMGLYECGDRTATYLDGRFDVFMGYGQEAYDEAIKFGIQERTVTIY